MNIHNQGNENNWVDQQQAALEARLRSYYKQTYGADSLSEAIWAQLEADISTQQLHPQRKRLGSLVQRLTRPISWTRSKRWAIGGLTTMLLLVTTISTLALWTRPTPVSAQAILERAQAADASALVRSYHLRATSTYHKSEGKVPQSQNNERWQAGEALWREDNTTYDNSGTPIATDGAVLNGDHLWKHSTQDGQTQVGEVTFEGENNRPKTDQPSLADILAAYTRRCQIAQQQGEETVVGRATYVIELRPDTQHCPPEDSKPLATEEAKHAAQDAATPEAAPQNEAAKAKASSEGKDAQSTIGRLVLWLDEQTLVPLKSEQYTADGVLQVQYEVTDIEYNVDIPASIFDYTPPPGAVVTQMTEPRR